jgi:hypothetical protein
MGFDEPVIIVFNSFKKSGDTVGQPSLWQISSVTGVSGTHS